MSYFAGLFWLPYPEWSWHQPWLPHEDDGPMLPFLRKRLAPLLRPVFRVMRVIFQPRWSARRWKAKT